MICKHLIENEYNPFNRDYLTIDILNKFVHNPPDRVIVMAVQPGYSGQAFIESTYDRIRSIKNILPSRVT